MSLRSRIAARWPKDIPVQIIPKSDWANQQPTFQDAQPRLIESALHRAEQRPSGNWYVFAASTDVRTDKPFGTTVGGLEIVAWRDQQRRLHVGPAACPHLGADLATGTLDCGALICPWHGLRLEGGREFGWKPLPAFDDGVLVWVRLDKVGHSDPLDAPVIPARPTVTTPVEGLMLAGDGIRIDLPVALMERAATTGWSAANRLLAGWGISGHTLHTVPVQGRSPVLRRLATREGRALT